MAPIVTTS
ncbi:hypothetical protein D030_1790A, partial [Vibrio parahaemolyticus AQ3810]